MLLDLLLDFLVVVVFVLGFLVDDLDFVVVVFDVVDFFVDFGFVDFALDVVDVDLVVVFFAAGLAAEVFFAAGFGFAAVLGFAAVSFSGTGLLSFFDPSVSAGVLVDRTPIESISTRE